MRGNRCPAVKQDACSKGTGNYIVERAGPTIGDVTWDEATEKANAIQYDDEVEGVGLAKMDHVPAEGTDLQMVSIQSGNSSRESGLYVEIPKVLAPEHEEHP